MKYFSEITNKTYDTIAELVKDEKSVKNECDSALNRVKEARKAMEDSAIPVNKMHNAVNALWEEYDKKCDEVLDADVIKKFVDEFRAYEEILSDFVEEYGKVNDELSDEVKEALDHAAGYEDIFNEDFCECDDDDCCGNCMNTTCDRCEVAEADAESKLTDELDFSNLKRIGDGEYFGEGEKDGVKWKVYVKDDCNDQIPSFHNSFSRLLRNIFS